MRTLVSALLAASVAFGAEPDAGVNTDAPRAVVLEAGQAAPSTGMFLPEALAITSEKDRQACHAERGSLQRSPPVVAIVVAAAVALGGGIALGFGLAQLKK